MMVTEDRISEALKKHGAFFAFSNEQFDEQKKEGIIYVSLGAGLIAPKATFKELLEDMKCASHQIIVSDKQTHTAEEIINRELANHEAQISGSIEDTAAALKGYGYSKDQIEKQYSKYLQHCIEHDLF